MAVGLFASTGNVHAGTSGTLKITSTDKHQTVTGFGAFVCSPQFSYNHMSTSDMNLVWGSSSTVGCNIMRLYIPIGKSAWSESLAAAKYAKQKGMILFASPWGQPSEWKTNGSSNAVYNGTKGYLKTANYGDYATYLNDYVTYLKNNGVTLDAISIQNEPDWPCSYAGCLWTTDQITDFIKNYADKINCKVIAPETVGMSNDYANALNQSSVLANFDIYGGHQYGGVGTAFKNLANQGKALWMTEYLINWNENSSSTRDFSWSSDAYNFAEAINTCMLNNVNAWIHYTAKRFYGLVGDGQYGSTSGAVTKRGYIMAQFAKYITGMTRVTSTAPINGSTYISQNGDTIVAVLINSTSTTYTMTVQLPFTTTKGTRIYTSQYSNLKSEDISINSATSTPQVDVPASSITTLRFVKSGNSSSSTTTTITGSSSELNLSNGNMISEFTTGSNTMPSEWTVYDNGTQVTSGTQTSGPRIMEFTSGGDFTNGLYVRTISSNTKGYAEYGRVDGYKLTCGYGNYWVQLNAAAWKNSPYIKVEVLNPSENVVASRIVQLTKNLNGSTNQTVSNANYVGFSFYALDKGNYVVRITPVADASGNTGDWQEIIVGNVQMYYEGNPLVFSKANTVPTGWNVVEAGSLLTAGEATSGPRIFNFTSGGDFSYGLYVRQSDSNKSGYAEYGATSGYSLTLLPGSYNISYNAVAWKNSPYLKCEVINSSNVVVGSQIIQLTKNVNGNLTASTSSSNTGVVNFDVSTTGIYHIRWTPVADADGNSGSWLEAVIGHIKINYGHNYNAKTNLFDTKTTDINEVENTTTDTTDDIWYTLQGVRLAKKPTAKGIYIHKGKTIIVSK